MSALNKHQQQLEQVLTALKTDPDNTTLKSLKTDLEEAISLEIELGGHQQKPTLSQKPTSDKTPSRLSSLHIGDKCQVRSSGGGWQDAVISSTGSNRSRWVVITCKNNETKSVEQKDVRPIPACRAAPILELLPVVGSDTPKPKSSSELSEKGEKEKKIKKAAARSEYLSRKETEHQERANAWSSFRSKLAKKTSVTMFKNDMIGRK